MIAKEPYDQYEATIGIECHVQLATKTKLFSGASNDARTAKPNTTVSPICFGLPGVLPVLNKQAVALSVRAGVALNAHINLVSSFDRKHYFYPDLPLGYQITQMDRPIIIDGKVTVPLGDEHMTVRVERAHMEADAGKLTHPAGADYSLVDLNRAGTPLLEIVSAPDMHTPAEAKAYVQELYLLMTYADVTWGDLYHGNMRFDVNISVAKKGATALGTRAEIKNLNSFRSVEKVVTYEFKRQVDLVEQGESIVQETRGWDDAKQKTFSQRSKENAEDYRYFPDSDIPPISLREEDVQKVRNTLTPQLPPALRTKLAEHGVPRKDITTLFLYPLLLDRTMKLIDIASDEEVKQIVSLLVNVLPAEFDKVEEDAYAKGSKALGNPQALLELARLVREAKISSTSAKELLRQTWQMLEDPAREAEKRNMLQVSDEGEIAAIVDEVLNAPESQKSVQDIKAGNERAIGFLVGQVMKRSQGKANPGLAQKLIRDRLSS